MQYTVLSTPNTQTVLNCHNNTDILLYSTALSRTYTHYCTLENIQPVLNSQPHTHRTVLSQQHTYSTVLSTTYTHTHYCTINNTQYNALKNKKKNLMGQSFLVPSGLICRVRITRTRNRCVYVDIRTMYILFHEKVYHCLVYTNTHALV